MYNKKNSSAAGTLVVDAENKCNSGKHFTVLIDSMHTFTLTEIHS